MMADAQKPQGRLWVKVLAVILSVCNVAVAIFGVWMLVWAIQELGYKGEQWGLLGVMIFSGASVAVLLFVLLPLTTLAISRGRSVLPRAAKVFLIAALAAGGAVHLAALACIPLNSMKKEDDFKKDNPLYASGLYDAVKKGDVAAAEAILKSDESALSGSPFDLSVLSVAVQNDDRPMVELLLRYGAEVDDGGGGQPKPLHLAARRGNIEIARILLDHGADVNAEDSDSSLRTPLTYAQKAGKTAMVEFLRSKGGSDVNLKQAAWRAAYFGRIDELRALLDQGLDVNTTWPGGTLLDTPAEEGNLEIVKLLVERGAKLQTGIALGGPVHSAAYEGKTEVVAYLLSRGANPNALEPQNRSPLYWASQNGHLETVRALLAGGADPNAGESALKEAKRQGHNDVVELLRQHGAKE